jgi:hypothetical protein
MEKGLFPFGAIDRKRRLRKKGMTTERGKKSIRFRTSG